MLAATAGASLPAPAVAATKPPWAYTVHRVTAADLGVSWRPGCPVGPSNLRRIRFRYVGWDGVSRYGNLVVHRDTVYPALRAFHRLYDQDFPVRSIRPVTAFGGSDARSMAADNTSAFNCRRVTGGTAWSRHAYGRAVDVNPVENPYVKGDVVEPPAGTDFVDRTPARKGMLVTGSKAVRAFTDDGWTWGGGYRTLKDWQHFER